MNTQWHIPVKIAQDKRNRSLKPFTAITNACWNPMARNSPHLLGSRVVATWRKTRDSVCFFMIRESWTPHDKSSSSRAECGAVWIVVRFVLPLCSGIHFYESCYNHNWFTHNNL